MKGREGGRGDNGIRGRGPRNHGRGRGRGYVKFEARFKGANGDLPFLDYGSTGPGNKPIEFLERFGEYCAVHHKSVIYPAFYNIPADFGEPQEEPALPDNIPDTPNGKAMLGDYMSERKEWKGENRKIMEQIGSVFALVWGQLSESSRCEVRDCEEWEEAFLERDLLVLIDRLRATHIARQSGNPSQDQERTRIKWANLRMGPTESSFEFRKRVEDHQLEREAVGLEPIPDQELIIGLLNRLDLNRYADLVRDYFENERRGIRELPEIPSVLWKEIKDKGNRS